MSKSIILYESKTGCTKKCAEYVKEKNPDSEILKLGDFVRDIDYYDNYVIMTPTYMGRINKKVNNFLKINKGKLLTKNLTIAVIGMDTENHETTIKNNFDEDIVKHAEIVFPGGGYNMEKLNFFYRFIIKKVAGETKSKECIDFEKLDKIKI